MKKAAYFVVAIAASSFADPAILFFTTQSEIGMHAEGTFQIELVPERDEKNPAGRMIIRKTYSGDLIGSGVGQMISKRTSNGSAVYFAVEEFNGNLKGNTGTFTLIHKGAMTKESQSLDVYILEGSGNDELEGITGSLSIVQEDGNHSYELNYKL
jgi:hypothetical protein